ncbi:MAG: hypothetical protein EHM51_00420 [Geobacter sp.]|nr:MAG: hypothetical protein EHM51_00420 [Geobacter sp.]
MTLSIYRLASIFSLAALTLLLGCGNGWAADRDELGKVLLSMPPNGPFWKYGNVVMRSRSKKANTAPVVFPHWGHRAQFTCRVCHTELGFSMRSGDTGITRAQYLAGKYCGACHDGNTAFSVKEEKECVKCHMRDTVALEKRFEKFAEDLPMASFGNGIDWADALEKGSIYPTDSILADTSRMQFPQKLKKPVKLTTTSPRSDVTFSHEEHFAELDCSSCHPDIFNIKTKGTQAFSMERNVFGNYCGVCHMQVAFPMQDCRRCHPKMNNGSRF